MIKSSALNVIHQEGDSQDSKPNTKSFNNISREVIIVCECLGINYVKLFIFDQKKLITQIILFSKRLFENPKVKSQGIDFGISKSLTKSGALFYQPSHSYVF